jgi:asparagine synthase (glutamine-hydrolysing)
MSGIFGFILSGAHPVDQRRNVAAAMSSELEFRGDTIKTFFSGEEVMLGGRYFAHEQVQPCFSDDSCIVVMEGEIYNKCQLIDTFGLEKKAAEGEIVAFAYTKFGLDFAYKFNGIFAIAIFDKKNRQIVLIRDHVGSKSLFYAKNTKGIFFATTIKALLRTELIDRTLSINSIHSYFSSTSVSPPDTMFCAIRCLRPGTAMVFSEGGESQEHSYWNTRDIQEDYSRSLGDFAEEVRELLIDAVRLRGGIGGRYGSIVSGGVDSSVVTALLARNLENKDPLSVFSIVFEEKPYSDEPLQRIMYDAFNLKPYSASITAKEYWNTLHEAVDYQDNPVNDDAMVGMSRVFQLARSVGCTALFEGEAADELFFTGHVHAERQFQKFLLIPFSLRKLFLAPVFRHTVFGTGFDKKIRRLLFRLGLSDTERRLLVLPSFYRTSRSIIRPEIADEGVDPLATARGYLTETRLRDPLNIYYYGILKSFLPDDLLFKNERAASVNAVTNRTPFIDYRLVELAFKIPERFKVRKPEGNDDGTKIVYKKAIEGIIPDEILRRKKTRGFSQPSSGWYRGQLKAEVHDLLFSKDALSKEYLDSDYVTEIYTKHQSNISGYDYLMTSFVIFEIWLQKYAKFNWR